MAKARGLVELLGAERVRETARFRSGLGAKLVSGVFERAAKLRRRRVFHPHGVLLRGRWWEGDGAPDRPVTARLSKGIGTPSAVPDLLGLAIRVEDGARPWDLTLVSAGPGALGRAVLWPGTDWSTARYSSIVPYRTPTGLRWLEARFDESARHTDAAIGSVPEMVAHDPLTLTVEAVGPRGRRESMGRARFDHAEPDATHPAFDPMASPPPGLRLYPSWLSKVRELAYHGSRVGRDRGGRDRRGPAERTEPGRR